MTRGIHKQIVVLSEFDGGLFEQAIFILRPEAARRHKNGEDVLKEAKRVVDSYAARNGLPAPKITKPPTFQTGVPMAGEMMNAKSFNGTSKLKNRVFAFGTAAVILLIALITFLTLFS